jgi:cell division protein ZapE
MAFATSCPRPPGPPETLPQSPLARYRRLVEDGALSADPQQLEVLPAFERIWRDIDAQPRRRLFGRLRRRRPEPVRGLYLWGGVGRGKTRLMDLFYDCLPATQRQRIHFHRFMQRIHAGLRAQGAARDPLPRVAADWAAECRVLCLDEFYVADIADAMLLAGLLENLFARGVTLVATSNVEPDQLYRDGLQRAKFLPAIDRIKQYMQVLQLGGETDFRLRILEQSEIYHHPLDEAADAVLLSAFERIAADCELNHDLEINGRAFHARRRGDGVIWFDFDELCRKPRGAVDYIEIARAFNTVVISGTPQLDEAENAAARRFITLVDEFYDRNVKLLMSAQTAIPDLYAGHRLAFEFQRTASRLTEMQSHDYLARPHLP